MHDLLRIVENIIIFFQVMTEAMTLFFTDLEAFFKFDQGEELKKRLDVRDTITNNKLALKQYTAEWEKARDLKLSGHITGINRTADAWERANRAASLYSRPKNLPGSADAIERWLNKVAPKTAAVSADVDSITSAISGDSGASTAAEAPKGPTGIHAWLAKTQEEATIAQKRIELIGKGLSEAVTDSILAASDPIGTANDALFLIATGGLANIKLLTEAFQNSAAGQKKPTQPKQKSPTGIDAWLDEAKKEGEIARKRIQLIGAGLSEAVAESITSGADGLLSANEALKLLASDSKKYVSLFTKRFRQTADGQKLAADKAAEAAKKAQKKTQEALEAAEKLRQKEQDIIDKRKAAFESFSDSVKSIFGGIKDSIMSAFSLPDLGNSVNSITRNIQKLLARTKDFAKNITSLSKQGLSNDLLQQVIAAGPIAGGRLAQALATAGGGTIRDLNRSFAEFGGIASGIAGVGTRSEFANRQVVNNYKIEVNGGVGSGPSIGKAIVDAIKSYERTSGAVWQGA
jgi:hypothetical protein